MPCHLTESYKVGKKREGQAEEMSDLAMENDTTSQRREKKSDRLVSSSDEHEEPVLT